MDATIMRELDALCLPLVKNYSAGQLKKLRLRYKASEAVFAAYLNTSPSTVQKLEQGKKQPNDPSLKLLNIVDQKGLDAFGSCDLGEFAVTVRDDRSRQNCARGCWLRVFSAVPISYPHFTAPRPTSTGEWGNLRTRGYDGLGSAGEGDERLIKLGFQSLGAVERNSCMRNYTQRFRN